MTASTSFKQISGIDWLRKRDALPSEVPSKRFCTDLEWIKTCDIAEEGCRLSAWFPDAGEREIEEDVVGLGSYERLLTVLMTEEAESEDDDDEGEQDGYIDRWKQGYFRPKR